MFSSLSNQFFRSRCNTPKRVTSWRGPSPRHCAQATQLLLKKCRSGGRPLATLCLISCRKFEPQTSLFIGERLTARPTRRSLLLVALNIVSLETFAEFVVYLIMFGNERLITILAYYYRIFSSKSN